MKKVDKEIEKAIKREMKKGKRRSAEECFEIAVRAAEFYAECGYGDAEVTYTEERDDEL